MGVYDIIWKLKLTKKLTVGPSGRETNRKTVYINIYIEISFSLLKVNIRAGTGIEG